MLADGLEADANRGALAAAYTDRVYLWSVSNPARPRLLATLADPVAPPWRAGFSQGDIAFSPDGRLLASTAGHNQVAVWNVTDPAHATRIATVPSGSGFIYALAFSPRGHLLAVVSYNGTVTVLNLANPAHPARTATMQTVTARQITDSICTGGCGPCYTLQFGPGGQTLTAVADLSPPSQQALSATAPQPSARNYAFFWNVANPRSVTRTAVLSHPVTISGGSTLAAREPQRAHHRDRRILRLRGDTMDAALTRASRCPPPDASSRALSAGRCAFSLDLP